MKELLDKLSSYNIFNYLFPGIVFCYLSNDITGYQLVSTDIIIGVFYYYLMGLIISRIGSIVIEPIFKKLKIVNFASYAEFIEASKKDPKIEVLSETNNMFRTLISLFFLLLLFKLFFIFETICPMIIRFRWLIISISLISLFIFGYRKQTNYIADRIKIINNKEKK